MVVIQEGLDCLKGALNNRPAISGSQKKYPFFRMEQAFFMRTEKAQEFLRPY
jgi:hypothetical protein